MDTLRVGTAEICHQYGFGPMEENIVALATECIRRCRILFAVGILENPYHETCRIAVLRTDEIIVEEPALQEESKRLLPRLHFNPLDVKIPMVLKNDRQVLQAAIRTSNIEDFGHVRLARARNTLCIDEMEISESLLEEAAGHPLVEILSDPYTLSFDGHGNLF